MPKPIDTPEYWIDGFSPSSSELDSIYEHVLEAGRPVTLDALAGELIRLHVRRVTQVHRASVTGDGVIYRPNERYEVGQRLIFPALDGNVGVVAQVRSGNNPDYGEYEVVRVKMNGGVREFAIGLQWEHPLSQTVGEVDPDEMVTRFGPLVAPQLAAALGKDAEWLSLGERWILKALLPEINTGHRNLAEAILMLGGQAMPATQILPDLEIDESTPLETRAIALDLALSRDDRFRNVGTIESPLWALKSQA
jgi:hypothetical protein